jgi:hypothetical protein
MAEEPKTKGWKSTSPGWREFIADLGTIALGVPIALGAEQALDRLSSHERVMERGRT